MYTPEVPAVAHLALIDITGANGVEAQGARGHPTKVLEAVVLELRAWVRLDLAHGGGPVHPDVVAGLHLRDVLPWRAVDDNAGSWARSGCIRRRP